MPWRKTDKADKSPLKLLLWTAIAGLIFGLIGFGELPEDLLRASRNSLHWHKASGDIVLVKIDDRSLREAGRWPWPRRHLAAITDRLTEAGAERIFFDFVMDAPTSPHDDQVFEESLKKSGRVTLAALPRSGPDKSANRSHDLVPLERFAQHAELASISVRYNWQNAAWRVPYANYLAGDVVSSFAAKLAGRSGGADRLFIPDYSLDPMSVPSVSASDILHGQVDPRTFAGKDVVVAAATETIGDELFLPGTGRMAAVYVQIIGAETLKAGEPRHLGWIPLFALTLAIAAVAATRNQFAWRVSILGGWTLTILCGATVSEAHLLYFDVVPSLFILMTIGTVLTWRGFRQRGLTNPVTGLPNLSALRTCRAGQDSALIAARVLNYEEIVATLPAQTERQLAEQIVARLRVGAPNRTIYQGDGGIFAWFEAARLPFANHVEALHALFRNPAKIGGQPIDLSISFGVEIGSSRSLTNRLASAVVAAEEAAHDGLKWKYHDPESLHEASWKLSMLSQLDAAVDNGEIWVAYQPKLDLKTRRVIGVEALARWTHPEKGPIAASEFIAAAEQHDRIGKLTDFVLQEAIRSAAVANRKQQGFSIAVNLSARLLDDRGFVLRLSAMLARYRLPANCLTLELTETAALANNGTAADVLSAIRDLGVVISIDDYGTGLSTLDYLKKVPASELKIDQSFVKGMLDNRSDLVMVQSTIALAHSLGRKVVAEGVERHDVLEALVGMECDVAQGFIIGRPMSMESVLKRISASARHQVA